MMRIELIGKQECKTILVKYFLTDYKEMATNWQQKTASQNNICNRNKITAKKI